jgi:hypothetical protein
MIAIFFVACLFSVSSQNCQDPSLQTLNFFVVSNRYTQVVGPDMLSQGQAVHCWVHPAWTASIPGATWIWDRFTVSNPGIQQTVYYKVQFYIPGVPSAGTLRIAADDIYTVTVNGQGVGCIGASFTAGSERQCNVYPYLVAGMNTAQFSVTNTGGGPAGLLYKFDLEAKV